MAATNDSAAGSNRLTLMGLPAEVRGAIFEAMFPSDVLARRWACFNIRSAVYASHILLVRNNRPACILRTSRTLLDEGLHHIYTLCNTEVNVVVLDKVRYPTCLPNERIVEDLENLRIWPYISNLKIEVRLWSTDRQVVLMGRIRRVIDALEQGRHLKSLQIVLDWPDRHPVPHSFDGAVEALQGFDMSHLPRERVSVRITGDMDDDEKEVIESRLEQNIRGVSKFVN